MTKTIRTFHAKAQGESHKAKNTPCQDASLSFEDHEKGIYIGVLSDGHGSKTYFRSDRGSQLAVDITLKSIQDLLNYNEDDLFQEPFVNKQAVTTLTNEVESTENNPDANISPGVIQKRRKNDEVINQLLKSIVQQWYSKIEKDWQDNPVSKESLTELGVPESAITTFMNNESIEEAYGCTLLAFVRTNEFWFAFQIGDGKCIAFDQEMNASEPIPWDEKCSGNTTTSLCEPTAIDSFRYAYGNDSPVALYIGSDGLDGIYGDMDEFTLPKLKKQYRTIIKAFINEGYDIALEELKNALPIWSKNGFARDDMSLAAWIDLRNQDKIIEQILAEEKIEAEEKLAQVEEDIEKNKIELQGLTYNISDKKEEVITLDNEIQEIESSQFNLQRTIDEWQEKINLEKENQITLASQKETLLKKKEAALQEQKDLERILVNNEKKLSEKEVEKKSFWDKLEEFLR